MASILFSVMFGSGMSLGQSLLNMCSAWADHDAPPTGAV